MFNQHVLRTGNSVGATLVKKSVAALGAIGIIGGFLIAAPAANAATPHATWAQGRFLSGTIAGIDLAKLAELTPATARNNGAQGAQEVLDPLAVGLLGSSPLSIGSLRVSPDQILSTSTTGGVLSQYARAEKSGASLGASGTVGEGGAIGPNASNPGGNLSLAFQSLLGSTFSDAVTDLRLHLQAIAAKATGTSSAATGSYYLDGATLSFTSPALAKISTAVTTAVSGADSELNSLTGRDGELAVALRALLLAANPALDLGASAHVTVTLTRDLQSAVSDLLAATWGGGGVSINFATGRVTLDLNAIVGNLNDLPPNTELLTGARVSRILATIAANVSELSEQVVARLTAALQDARLDVDADLTILTDQAPVIGQVCQYEDAAGNILSDVLGKLLGSLVCTSTTTLLPKLETSVAVDLHGAVSRVVGGTAPVTATAKVLSLPVTIGTGHLLDVLGATLGTRIFGASGVLPRVTGLINGPLLTQANLGLLGSAGIGTVLSGILSLKVNLQETNGIGSAHNITTGTVFTETALRVSVAKVAGTPGLTTLNLASAAVAPKLAGGTTGDPGNPGDPGTPGGPGSDTPGGGTTPTGDVGPRHNATGPLAYTGVAIGAAIAILLALLAAGGWMAWEGRRRNHPTLES